MRRWIALAFPFLLAGCGGSESSPSDPFLGPWTSADDAAWFGLEAPADGFATYDVPVRPEQIYREGSHAAIIVEVAILSEGPLNQFAVVANPSAMPKVAVQRTSSSTTFTNETLVAPMTLENPLSVEPFFLEVLDPDVTDHLRILVGAAGASAKVVLAIVPANPQGPTPAATSEDLLESFRSRGSGHALTAISSGQGFKVIDYESWTLSGAFGKQQGVRSNGELQVDATLPGEVGLIAPVGPFKAALETGTWAGQFEFRYMVQPAVGSYEERGQVFGQDAGEAGTLDVTKPGTSTLVEAVTPGAMDWSVQITRVGAPDVEQFLVSAALFGGPIG